MVKQIAIHVVAAACMLARSATSTRDAASFNILDYGAVGDNSTLNTRAIQLAIDDAAKAIGGGLVVVPRGIFVTGTVTIVGDGVSIGFEDGGTLQGSGSPADYTFNDGDWDYWHVVQAINATNTELVGLGPSAGTLDGGGIVGNLWSMVAGYDPATGFLNPQGWTASGCIGECRVKNLAFIDCENVTVSGIFLQDSSDWTLLYRRSVNVLMEDVTTRGPVSWPNGDGMDVESGHNITLRRLNITTGDDAIAMRSGNCNTMRTPWPEHPISPLYDVRIYDCVLRSSSAAIKIENLFQLDHGNVSNIDIQNTTIHNSNRGIGIWQRISGPSGGWMGNISVRNASIQTYFMKGEGWWGSGEALVVTSVPETAAQAAVGLPGIHNVSFQDITAVAENGCLFSARDQSSTNPQALTGLRLSDVSMRITRFSENVTGSNATWAQRDYRPTDEGAPTPDTIPALVDGIRLENVYSALLENVSITFVPPAQPSYWDGPGGIGYCLNSTGSGAGVVVDGLACSLAG